MSVRAADRHQSSVNDVLARSVDVFVLGAAWVLASLPLVTILAASCGAESVASGWRRRSTESAWTTFWNTYRGSLGTAVRAQLILTGPIAVGVMDIGYAAVWGLDPTSVTALGFGFVLVAGSAAVATTVPALVISQSEHRARALLRDALLVTARFPGRSLRSVALVSVATIAVVFVPPLVPFVVVGVSVLLSRWAHTAMVSCVGPAACAGDLELRPIAKSDPHTNPCQ